MRRYTERDVRTILGIGEEAGVAIPGPIRRHIEDVEHFEAQFSNTDRVFSSGEIAGILASIGRKKVERMMDEERERAAATKADADESQIEARQAELDAAAPQPASEPEPESEPVHAEHEA